MNWSIIYKALWGDGITELKEHRIKSFNPIRASVLALACYLLAMGRSVKSSFFPCPL